MVSLNKVNLGTTQAISAKNNPSASQVVQVSLNPDVAPDVAKPGKVTRVFKLVKQSLASIGYALIQKLNRDSKELYEAVKSFDNLNPKSNAYLTAKRRYERAVEKIEDDIVKIYTKDKRSIISKISSNASDKNFRIYTEDKRYGFDIRHDYKKYGISRSEAKKNGVTFEEFVGKIVERHETNVKKSYDAAIDKAANELVTIFRKNVGQSQKLAHKRNRSILDIASKNEFKNVLGKNFDLVSKDLDAATLKKLGNVQSYINNIERKMNDKFGFWNDVGAYRKELNKAYQPEYADRNAKIKELQKELQKLQDADKALKRQWANMHKIAHDDSETAEKIAKAKELVVKNEAEMKKVQAKIEDVKNQVEQLKIDQAKDDTYLGVRYAKDLNAQRRQAYLLDGKKAPLDLKMPENPTLKEIWKRRAKRTLVATALATALVGAAALVDHHYGWPVKNKAIELGSIGCERTTKSVKGFWNQLWKPEAKSEELQPGQCPNPSYFKKIGQTPDHRAFRSK